MDSMKNCRFTCNVFQHSFFKFESAGQCKTLDDYYGHDDNVMMQTCLPWNCDWGTLPKKYVYFGESKCIP